MTAIRKNILGWLILVLNITFGYKGVQAQEKLHWQPFEDAITLADSANRPIFVNVWAPWCGWCRKMERDVYPVLAEQLNNHFVLTRLNRDDNSGIHQYQGHQITPLRLAKKLQADNVPAIVLLDARGDYLLHITGFIKAKRLQPVLRYISSSAYKSQTFEDFTQNR
jgi:thioredoxin-related protein